MPSALTAAIAGLPGRATVYRAALALFVRSDVRRHAQGAQVPDKVSRVIGPVRAERGPPMNAALEHRQGSLAFGVSACPWLEQGSAWVNSTSTTRPLRFSVSRWPK